MKTTQSNRGVGNQADSGKMRRTETLFVVLIAIFMTLSILTNIVHEYDLSASSSSAAIPPQFSVTTPHNPTSKSSAAVTSKDSANDQHKKKIINSKPSEVATTKKHVAENSKDKVDEIQINQGSDHRLAGLSCSKFGGPNDNIASEMVYWSDIPKDSDFESPFKTKKKDGPVQYMTFEPDGGGWNNIRMAMETVVVLAHAMGRTLVLPPAQGMYLLRKDRKKQNTDFSFADFFHLETLNYEHSGLDIITTEQFLLREAMTGNLRNKTSGEVVFPPNNTTNWDGKDIKPLKEWLREVIVTPLWKPGQCLAAFPSSGNPDDAKDLHKMLEVIKAEEVGPRRARMGRYVDDPTPVNASTIDRMREALDIRRELCIYDHEMQAAPVLHFMCYHKMRIRLLTHFYSFVFFEDWKQQLWTNRFVRDHLRYLDELQCAAARVVDKLRTIARMEGQQNGEFDTFHVRRGDFQYKETRVEAKVLLSQSKDQIPAKATLYIATDERKKDFFNVLKEHYNVYFLDDFKDLYQDLNTNYYGMLDQLIAARGRTFFGTWSSTFTGYINRMRGYSTTKFHTEGWNNGTIQSYYFFPETRKDQMRHYSGIFGPYYAREFPTAWYDIDKDT